MIQRERYINKIKPFIGKDVIKVLTGIRRSGKHSEFFVPRIEKKDFINPRKGVFIFG